MTPICADCTTVDKRIVLCNVNDKFHNEVVLIVTPTQQVTHCEPRSRNPDYTVMFAMDDV